MDWSGLLNDALRMLAFLGVYAVVFLVAKQAKDILTPYKLIEELAKKDNPAVGLSLAGYLLATAIIFVGVLAGPSAGLLRDLTVVTGYSLLGMVFLNLARWSLDKLVFHKFCDITAIVEHRNMGMASVRAGYYLATGLIAAGSLGGQGGGVHTAVAFFVLGQATLWVFSRVYDFIAPFDLQHEIESGNVAAGVAFGGTLVALGMIVGKAVSGDFIGWQQNLALFAEVAVVGMIALVAVRFAMDKLILTGHDINYEIAQDRNTAAAFVEMSVANCFALVIVALM